MLWDQNPNCHHFQGTILSHLTAALTSRLSFLLSLLSNLTWHNNVSVFFLKQSQSIIPKTIIHFVFHMNGNTLWAILPSGPAYRHAFISIIPILIQPLITSKFCNYPYKDGLLFLSRPSLYSLVSLSLAFSFLSAVHIMSPALSNPFSCTSLPKKSGPPHCDPSLLLDLRLVLPSRTLCSGETGSSPHTYPPQPACVILFAPSGTPSPFLFKIYFKICIYLLCWVSLVCKILDPCCGMWDLKLWCGELLVAEWKALSCCMWGLVPWQGSNPSTPHSTLAIGPEGSPKNLDFFFLAAPCSFLNQVLNLGPRQWKHWVLTPGLPGKPWKTVSLLSKPTPSARPS